MPQAKKATANKSADTKIEDGQAKAAGGGATDAEALLKADHRKVEQLFQKYEGLTSSQEKARCAQEICKELIVHAMLEEELFYPACRDKNVESDQLDEAQVEHDGAKLLIAELLRGSPDDAFYEAKVSVLAEYIKHHVGEEEKGSDGLFALARKAGVDMSGLGQALQARKEGLLADMEGERLAPPRPRSLQPSVGSRSQEESMARYDDDRGRDRYGRFSGGNGGSSRGGRYGSNERDRDEQGRFMSEDDRGYGSRGSSRYEDDDDDRGYRGRSSSSSRGGSRYGDDDDGRGWYGDPRGHAEAARLGWERRGGGGGGSGRYDDDRGGRSSSSRGGSYGSRSRYEDDDRGYRGGSSSRGWERDEGQGGWFGDSEGHAEASRLGWEHRRGGGYGGGYGERGQSSRSGGYGSRSRYEDDDDGRGHGRGGWFGDPEGHSEASRRGWRNRD